MLKEKIENSIIISVFNKTDYLRNCIISIMNQSVSPDEIIIADDGSSENIADGIHDIVSELSYPVSIVRQEDRGFRLAKSRNNAARHAKGNYLVFFDQDLIFTKNYLEMILANKEKNCFYSGYPVWLDEKQTKLVSPDIIRSGNFDCFLTQQQRDSICKQYRKERFYTILYSLKFRKIGCKLRGCVFSFYKTDFVKVNGFDETYENWGYEDDDLGHRLHASGISGVNRIYREYSMHCYHAKAQRADNGRSVNRPSFKMKKKEINKDNYRCQFGYDNPKGDDTVSFIRLN